MVFEFFFFKGSFDLEKIQRKSRGLGNLLKMALFTPLINRNDYNFSFLSQFQAKTYRKKLRPHTLVPMISYLVPMHMERG
jgi:hypothetical protein